MCLLRLSIRVSWLGCVLRNSGGSSPPAADILSQNFGASLGSNPAIAVHVMAIPIPDGGVAPSSSLLDLPGASPDAPGLFSVRLRALISGRASRWRA